MEINLLPDLVLKRRHDAHVKQQAMLASVIWVVLVLVIAAGSFGYNLIQKQRLASATSQYNQLDITVNSSDNKAFRAEALEVQTSLKALDDLYTRQERTSRVISRLSELLPKNVTVASINLSEGKRVSISGSAGSYTDVAKLVSSMKDSKKNSTDSQIYFDGVTFGGSNLTDKGASFALDMVYFYPPVGVSNASKK